MYFVMDFDCYEEGCLVSSVVYTFVFLECKDLEDIFNRHEDGWSFGELQSRVGAANWVLWGELRPSVVSTSPKVHNTNTQIQRQRQQQGFTWL